GNADQARMITALLPRWLIRKLPDRNPHLDAVRKAKALRHDADHRVAAIIEIERPAHNLRIAGEAALPQPVTQDHDRGPARLVFFGGKDAPPRRLYAQSRKQAGRHLPGLNSLRLASARQVVITAIEDGHFLEDALLRAPVGIVRPGDGHPVHLRT